MFLVVDTMQCNAMQCNAMQGNALFTATWVVTPLLVTVQNVRVLALSSLNGYKLQQI